MNSFNLQRLKYKIKYYYVKFMHLIGFCPKCFTLVNYTYTGKAVCPRGCKY